jgi:hypothetical protein
VSEEVTTQTLKHSLNALSNVAFLAVAQTSTIWRRFARDPVDKQYVKYSPKEA